MEAKQTVTKMFDLFKIFKKKQELAAALAGIDVTMLSTPFTAMSMGCSDTCENGCEGSDCSGTCSYTCDTDCTGFTTSH